MMTRLRTMEEILADADELATRFEEHEPRPDNGLDVDAITALRAAAAERHDIDAVWVARHAGMSFAAIGTFGGTTGEAARQQYTRLVA